MRTWSERTSRSVPKRGRESRSSRTRLRRSSKSAGLDGEERGLYFGRAFACNAEDFAAARGSADERDAGAGYVEQLCEKLDESLVGASVGGRSGDGDLDCSGVESGDVVAARSRMHADAECASVFYIFGEVGRIVVHAAPDVRLPKIAVPTRTQVLPSAMATVKSLVMPMDNCVSAGCAF